MALLGRVAAVAAGLVLVAGCADDPEPKVAPEPSSAESSASASASDSPSPSESAEALSPKETVQAWVEARNQALASGEFGPVTQLATEDCETCSNSIEPIRKVHAAGGKFETKGWVVVASKVESRTAASATVSTAIRYASGRTFPSAGAEPVKYDTERHIVQFTLLKSEGSDGWRISFIGYLS